MVQKMVRKKPFKMQVYSTLFIAREFSTFSISSNMPPIALLNNLNKFFLFDSSVSTLLEEINFWSQVSHTKSRLIPVFPRTSNTSIFLRLQLLPDIRNKNKKLNVKTKNKNKKQKVKCKNQWETYLRISSWCKHTFPPPGRFVNWGVFWGFGNESPWSVPFNKSI